MWRHVFDKQKEASTAQVSLMNSLQCFLVNIGTRSRSAMMPGLGHLPWPRQCVQKRVGSSGWHKAEYGTWSGFATDPSNLPRSGGYDSDNFVCS
jgi:hypothetical protein